MQTVRITPTIAGTKYYLQFEVQPLGQVTIYTLVEDFQSRLLGLPVRLRFLFGQEHNDQYQVVKEWLTIDSRAGTESRDLCKMLFHMADMAYREHWRPEERREHYILTFTLKPRS